MVYVLDDGECDELAVQHTKRSPLRRSSLSLSLLLRPRSTRDNRPPPPPTMPMYADEPEPSTSEFSHAQTSPMPTASFDSPLASFVVGLSPPSRHPGLLVEPPRKKSKWDDIADEEDKVAARERKRAKKAELDAKLAREREQLASRVAGSSRGGSTSSREGTPGRSRGLGEAREAAPGRGPVRGRETHPLLESCRSVYCYEVRTRALRMRYEHRAAHRNFRAALERDRGG